MSISLLLVPAALAATTAWQVLRDPPELANQQICHVGTRMKDPMLLAAALSDAGADVRWQGEELISRWPDGEVRFTREHDGPTPGIWTAHASDDLGETRAVELVRLVDHAYGRQVQRVVVERVKHRSAEAGMRIESETVDDDTNVTLVLALDRSVSR
jgi:hypothetical protein